MRIFPIVLITIGVVGVLKHFGLIDAAVLHLLWPLALIGIGVAMLVRGPRWRGGMSEREPGRWERRMHRHFGPGWAQLSEDERERFRAGMQQWRSHGGADGDSSAPASARGGSTGTTSPPPTGPGEQR